MNVADAARRIGELLEADGIDYAIGGALALGIWGAPRGTKDVDISVFAKLESFDRVADAFERAGVMFDRMAAAKDLARIGLFRGMLGRINVDVFMSTHPHFEQMQRRRQRVADTEERHLYFISAEDLVVMKLVYGRDKDVTDLERLFAVRPGLDLVYVRSWIAKLPVSPASHATLDDLERRFVTPRSGGG